VLTDITDGRQFSSTPRCAPSTPRHSTLSSVCDLWHYLWSCRSRHRCVCRQYLCSVSMVVHSCFVCEQSLDAGSRHRLYGMCVCWILSCYAIVDSL